MINKNKWIALKGKIYDFTDFDHPGGDQSILNCAGIDCTEIFESIHNWDMLTDGGFEPIGLYK